MGTDQIARLAGLVAFGVLGFYLELPRPLAELLAKPWDGFVLPFAAALFGAVATPYISTRPARQVRRFLGEASLAIALSGLLGLVLGLVVAALLAIPLGQLPFPFGALLPSAGALLCAWLGTTFFVARQREIVALARSRGLRIGAAGNPAAAGGAGVLLDTSVIIDGRIADIFATGFIGAQLWVPGFVLIELQRVADSADALRRGRGRRGLEILGRMQKDFPDTVKILDEDVPGVREVDDKLVRLGQKLGCAVMTNDFNLNRVAALQGVVVLNINELASAVRAVLMPGESFRLLVSAEGKELSQGVGYLEDGTMVVVDDGRRHIGATIAVVVTKVLQTAAGRMVFTRPE